MKDLQPIYSRLEDHGKSWAAYAHLKGIAGYWARRVRNFDGASHYYFHIDTPVYDGPLLRAVEVMAWTVADVDAITEASRNGYTGTVETPTCTYTLKDGTYMGRMPKGPCKNDNDLIRGVGEPYSDGFVFPVS